ncbi:MAG: hypothetical protein AABX47_07535 [Nanoarchaeota archaeon]
MKLEMRLYGVSGPDAISTRTPTGEAFFHQFFLVYNPNCAYAKYISKHTHAGFDQAVSDAIEDGVLDRSEIATKIAEGQVEISGNLDSVILELQTKTPRKKRYSEHTRNDWWSGRLNITDAKAIIKKYNLTVLRPDPEKAMKDYLYRNGLTYTFDPEIKPEENRIFLVYSGKSPRIYIGTDIRHIPEMVEGSTVVELPIKEGLCGPIGSLEEIRLIKK